MAGFDKRAIDKAIHGALNTAEILALVGGDSINGTVVHKRVPRGASATYPIIVYYMWDDIRPQYVQASQTSHYIGSYRITAFTRNEPILAEQMAMEIDNIFTNTFSLNPTPYTLMFSRCKRVISRVIIHDDTEEYHESGGIYEIGVAL